MRLFILTAIAMVALFAIGGASAKTAPSGTVAIASGYTAQLGQPLAFDYTVANIGGQNPRIEVDCFQSGTLVYAEARDAGGNGVNVQPFTPLGGGGSQWLTNGGPADCTATLYYWDFHPVQTFHPLATIEFDAAG